ncbi:hypothetical protein HZC21_04300 [Candidatus Peregrinibacteria bacterium]|nr:hypothetical protein [Candidatus Peregrinibacteria bacterium]
MISSPEQLKLDKLILKDTKLFYETIVRAIFRNSYVGFYKDVIWMEFWSGMSENNKVKIEKICHFYYYTCLPFKESYDVPDATRLVFTASIMESLMTGGKHIDFYTFLKLKDLKNISKSGLDKLIKGYRDAYGCSKNFRDYLEKYFLENDLIYLRHSIKKEKGGVFLSLDSNKELSDFFYSLRSQVVHNANLLTISNEVLGVIDFDLKGKRYKLDINIYEYLKSFEKSLIKFFGVQAVQF